MPKKKQEAVQTGGDSCACGCGKATHEDSEITAREIAAFAEEGKEPDLNDIPTSVKDEAEEILAPLPSELRIVPLAQIELHAELPVHDHPDDGTNPALASVEVYDVDGKQFALWEPYSPDMPASVLYLVDGHHHLARARMATEFVSSKIQAGRLVSAKQEVSARVFSEAEGWTLPLVKKLSYLMNFDGKRGVAVTLEPFGPDHPISDSTLICDQVDEDATLLADASAPGVLMNVEQVMTHAGVVTKHGYRYRPDVVQDAVNRARKRVALGLMISEYNHPAMLTDVCDANGCDPKFADNYDHKSARIFGLGDVGPDGRTMVKRSILDTKHGKIVEGNVRRNRAPLSVRWVIRGGCTRAKDGVLEPNGLDLVTVDDVSSPAVDGAGAVTAILDSAEESLTPNTNPEPPEGMEGLGEPFQGIARETVNPHPPPPTSPDGPVEKIANADSSATLSPTASALQAQKQMEPKEILKKVRAFGSLVRQGAPIDVKKVRSAHAEAANAILDAYREGDNITPYVLEYKVIFDSAEDAGYHAGTEAPHIHMGDEMGSDMAGWAPDLRMTDKGEKMGQSQMLAQNTSPDPRDLDKGLKSDEDKEKEKEDKEEKDREKMVKAKMDSLIIGGHPVTRLPVLVQDATMRDVRRNAKTEDEVSTMLTDAAIKWSSNQNMDRLTAMGFTSDHLPALGITADTAMPFATSHKEGRPDQAILDKLFAATDSYLKGKSPNQYTAGINPGSAETEELRKHNRPIANAIYDEWDKQLEKIAGKDKIWGALLADGASDPIGSLQKQIQNIAVADSYTTSIAQLPNQPTIMRWIGVQNFQDMRSLQFCAAMGPGYGTDGGAGWEMQNGIGRVFKLDYESYQDPPGWGQEYGVFDAGLLTPENVEIAEGTPVEFWQTYNPQWRFNATSATIQGIKSLGNGPLNLNVMARSLWHMSARKSRTIDTALSNEITDVSLEYGAVAITNETYNSANHGLANQTVYQNGSTTIPGDSATSVVVNLNPAKQASAVVVYLSDDYAVYPVPGVVPGPGGQLPIAAVRLLSGSIVGQNAAPYFGSNTFTRNPIVRPRTTTTLTSAGADSTSTLNPISVTAPSSATQGYLGSDGYIYSLPGPTATFAVDWTRGTIVFSSGVTASGSNIGVTVTLANYSYATNFDPFPIQPGINGLASTVTGETPQMFYSRLLGQFDLTAATMTAWPRFVAPDLAIMSPNLSAFITQATIFYKLNSPLLSNLYPSRDFFAERNDIAMARLNAPLFMGNDLIVLTRRYTTKYAIDTPWEVRGPAMKYGTAGNFLAGEGYWGGENSCIFTAQTQNSSGVINPVARGILTIGTMQV